MPCIQDSRGLGVVIWIEVVSRNGWPRVTPQVFITH
jgi:4-aminobutyrate aminotransferase-like enzyme